MKTISAGALVVFVATAALQSAAGQNLAPATVSPPRPPPTTASGLAATIPANLSEGFKLLDRQLQPADIQKLRAGDFSPDELRERFVPKLLDAWILPAGSPLMAYFHRLGIDTPEDMSGIVLTSYARYLRGQAIDLPRQVSYRIQSRENLPTPQKATAARQLWQVARSDKPLLPAAYSAAAVLVAQDFNGSELNHPGLTRDLVQQAWDSLGEYLAWRAARPLPQAPPAYADALSQLDPRPSTSIIPLDPRTTIIALTGAGIGHVMILTTLGDKRIAVWHIDTTPPKAGEDFATLSCWTPVGYRGRPCSPAAIGVLPDDAQGAHRFYIDAGYAQAAGATRGNQLSIWRWNGRAAEPLYVESYVTGGDAPEQGASLDGNELRIGMKGQYQTLDPCGACDGRQLVERLAVSPDDQIDHLSTVSLTPELDLLDEIYTRVRHNQDVGALANKAALEVIKRSWRPMMGRDFHDLFINQAETTTHDNGHTRLCFRAHYGLGTDLGVAGNMPPILFTFAGTGSQLQVTEAQEHASGCLE